MRRAGKNVIERWFRAPGLFCTPCKKSHWTLCVLVRGDQGKVVDETVNLLQSKFTIFTFCSMDGHGEDLATRFWNLLAVIDCIRGERKLDLKNLPALCKHVKVAVPRQSELQCGLRTLWHTCRVCISDFSSTRKVRYCQELRKSASILSFRHICEASHKPSQRNGQTVLDFRPLFYASNFL